MKHNQLAWIAIGIVAIGLIISPFTTKSSAQPQRESTLKHDVVLLQGHSVSLTFDVGDPGSCGNGYTFAGIDVYNSSCSSNAPTFKVATYWNCPPPGYQPPPRIPMAQAISDLLDQGYELKHADRESVLMVRKARR